jgi:transaldolase / glucose-6-phosphate isomerase
MSRLALLNAAGQSVWADFPRRSLIVGGGLRRLIREDAVTGVTSNPTIFRRAIAGSSDYDEAIRAGAQQGARSARDVLYDLALGDVRMATAVLRDVYSRSGGGDGFVSLELEPALAHDTTGAIAAARKLAAVIGDPNVMIKIPATPEGIPVVEQLIAQGVSVNVTLLFSISTYEQVVAAYMAGLDARLEAGLPLAAVSSVASFSISKVDSAIAPLLPESSPLRGQVAIANAKLAYRQFRHLFSDERWDRLARAGARIQRPLWGSTGANDATRSDVCYVESLVAPDTVTTLPEATLTAFRDHGEVDPRAIAEDADRAEAIIAMMPEHGIEFDSVADGLLAEGLATFDADFKQLLAAVQKKLDLSPPTPSGLADRLGTLQGAVARSLDSAARHHIVSRVWRRDHTVWSPDRAGVVERLGWLDLPDTMRDRGSQLRTFARHARSDGFTHAVLLGMGGSSLAARVYRDLLGVGPEGMELTVLDTTHPAAIKALEDGLDLDHTLFLVASKSGSTLETLCHFAYFFAKTGRPEQFVAITDPGSPLEALARRRGFRAVFLNPPDVGGRYSALSLFGLVPAALLGADLDAILEAGARMAAACNGCVPCSDNPGLWLGAVIGEAARTGRDKLTLVLGPGETSLGAWIEQLVAESTGKAGVGIVPVVDEAVATPDRYGDDRLFVALPGHAPLLKDLVATGHPVAQVAGEALPSGLGAEFFRWEFATAVAGHILGVNPFDQPDVEETKQRTRRLLEGESPRDPDPAELPTLLATLTGGDYVAIQAYVHGGPEEIRRLQCARLAVRDRHRVATTLGFGPRYLHSTGQLHKGGPDSGVFVQVFDGTRNIDLPIPGRRYSFGDLLRAQASGDFLALRRRGRRVARVTLTGLELAIAESSQDIPFDRARAHDV